MLETDDGFLFLAAVVIFCIGVGVGGVINEVGNEAYKKGYCAALGAKSQDNLCLFENGTYKEIPDESD